MSQAVKPSIEAYAFRADFQPPSAPASEAPVPEQVNMSAADLAGLLAEAREMGVADVLAQQEREDTERLQNITSQLNGALAHLVELAGHLDAASTNAALAEKSMSLINAAAKHIVDGQGDLFAELQPSRAELNTVKTDA